MSFNKSLLKEIQTAWDTVEEYRQLVKKMVINKEIPLDERWELFIKSDLGKDLNSYPNMQSKIGAKYVKDLEYKYEKHDIERILDYIEDEVGEEGEYTQEDIIEFKEEVLTLFFKSFIFDW